MQITNLLTKIIIVDVPILNHHHHRSRTSCIDSPEELEHSAGRATESLSKSHLLSLSPNQRDKFSVRVTPDPEKKHLQRVKD